MSNDKKFKAVAYIRVSTKEQDEHVQQRAIDDFARNNNIYIVKYYIDKGQSGAKHFKNRPAAQQLLNEINTIKPDIIIAWALDRLGRSMIDTVSTVMEFENKGIKVITVKEEWLRTLDSQIRKLILSILAWVAEFERERMKERREEAWRQGKQKGRPQKITDQQIIRYMRKYKGLNIKSIWKIMKMDGIDISYDRLRKRIKKLKNEGKI